MNLKFKVCGMTQAANIADVASLQPAYLGFIFYPKSPRCISEVSAELIRYVPDSINTIGVFVNEELEVVKAHILKYQLKGVQLHGKESAAYCTEIKSVGVTVIKAFGIDEYFDFSDLDSYSEAVDFFLFDTRTAAYGGSGKVFDWTSLKKYHLEKPYFLSGGISVNHIKEIKKIKDSRLYAIDVNSKFEIAPGLKDVEQLKEFFKEIR